MEKKPASPATNGIIIALISIVLFLVYYFMKLSFEEGILRWIPAIIMLALVIFFITKWANDMNNNVTFGQCFGYGFKMIAISTIIVFLFTVIFIYTFPDYKTQFLGAMRVKFNENHDLSDEQKSQAVGMMEKFFTISILAGSLLGNLIIGTIASLIGAAVAKKNPQTPFSQPQM